MTVWNFNNIRIYVQKISGGGKQIIPRLQPLAGGTVFQAFGYESTTTKLSGIIVGNDRLEALLLLKQSSSSYNLGSPEGTHGTFVLSDIKFDRVNCINQTMDPDLWCQAPVYNVELELIPDVPVIPV